jgi:hypothetical protein
MLNNTTMINTPARRILAKAELYSGSALLNTFTYENEIKSISIDRVGENTKFFGFGICQRLNIHLIDIDRAININTSNSLKIYFGSSEDSYISAFPTFFVSECRRDENTGELSITAYDMLYRATAINMQDALAAIGFGNTYNVSEFIIAAADAIKTKGIKTENVDDLRPFQLQYDSGANFDGTENARECLNAAAEITQTIYFINNEDRLVFKRIGEGVAGLEVSPADYFELNSKTNRRLTKIVHATELGDNVSATTGATGSTQYVRNNPFWELRTDIATLVENAIEAVGGFVINQFEMNWRGNYLLEIGDYITYTTPKGEIYTSYVMDDVIEYNGAFSEKTKFEFTDTEADTEENPSTIGEAIKATFARVDKANKEITLLASETEGNKEAIASLQINTDSISASVSRISEIEGEISNSNEHLAKLEEAVSAKITADEASLIFTKEISKGVGSVETATGFTFNEEGLTVSKTDSELSTTITEDGMNIYLKEEEVLAANNEGVKAKDLHATTYLIIGNYSRFEDYSKDGEARTGCFWLGG